MGGPEEFQGIGWWNLAGQGWVSEEFLAPHHEGDPPYPSRPELKDTGRIAYVGPDNDVWLMNADGSNKTKLYHVEQPNTGEVSIARLDWAPTGDKIAIQEGLDNIVHIVSDSGGLITQVASVWYLGWSWSPAGDAFAAATFPSSGQGTTLHVFDLNGDVLFEAPNAAAPSFSPDGRRLAYLENAPGTSLPPISRGMLADVERGSVQSIDPDEDPNQVYYSGPPMWSPIENLLAYGSTLINMDSREQITLPGTASGWSADGRFLLLGLNDIYDVERAEITHSFNFVHGPTDAAAWEIVRDRFAWSRDSRYFTHLIGGPYDDPPGPMLLEVYDSLSGKTYAIPGTPAVDFEFSLAGDHIAFVASTGERSGTKGLAGPWIYVVDADGTGLALLARGLEPTWQPGR